jgi:hypothetical protein
MFTRCPQRKFDYIHDEVNVPSQSLGSLDDHRDNKGDLYINDCPVQVANGVDSREEERSRVGGS